MKYTDSLSRFFRGNKYFYYIYFLCLIAGAFVFATIDKGDMVLWLNGSHTPFLDKFFLYTTFVGDGLFFAAVIIILLFWRIRYSIVGLVVFASSGLMTQLLKRIFDMPRPRGVMAESAIHFVEGATLYHHHAFPSGHTTTAFALFLFLSAIIPAKYVGPLFAVLAVVVAFSRVYLAQHFYMDIYFGSMVGVGMATLIMAAFMKSGNLRRAGWQDRSIIEVIRRK